MYNLDSILYLIKKNKKVVFTSYDSNGVFEWEHTFYKKNKNYFQTYKTKECKCIYCGDVNVFEGDDTCSCLKSKTPGLVQYIDMVYDIEWFLTLKKLEITVLKYKIQ